MKTEDIKKYMREDAEDTIAKFNEIERFLWQMFGEAFQDPKDFLKFIYHRNGELLRVVRCIQNDLLSNVEEFFTNYPYDCLDAWTVARLVKQDIRERIYKSWPQKRK